MNKLLIISKWLVLSLFASFTVLAQGNIEAGKAKSAMCAACHSIDGNSQITQYPKIAQQHTTYTEKQLTEFKLGATTAGEKGRYDPMMSPITIALSEQDNKDLAAYYASMPISDTDTAGDIAEQGKVLYLAGNAEKGLTACVACHGPRGNGTTLSGFPKISGQHTDYTKLQLMKFRTSERNNDPNAMMRDIAIKLTDEDINILSKYLSGLH